ncbi:hypothetical protein ACIBI3_22170 [Actinomadura luteofluorescens]|uniref:hypothetical protein n=1 Tax=Actinomadura luteofluorescens TaxID=46163 RepID=UPI00348F239F
MKKAAGLAGGIVGAALVAGGLAAVAPDDSPSVEPAAATSSESAGKRAGQRCATNTKVKKGAFVGTKYVKPNRHPWRVTGEGPNSFLEYSGEEKVSNKVTSSLNASYESISAGVGFEVSAEKSARLSYRVKLTKKAFYTIQVVQGFKGWKFHVWQDVGELRMGTPHSGIGLYCGVSKRNVYQGEAVAYDFWTLFNKCSYRAKGKTRNCSA